LHRIEIAQDEFRVDDFDVADRIDRAGDMVDVVVLKTAYDLNDRIDFADVGQKLVAEAFTRCSRP
jgi:hypothetical protein